MQVSCINQRGEQLDLGWSPPLFISSITGIGADFEVYTAKNTGQDGERYTGATANKRNIILVLDVAKKDYVEQRNNLYDFFAIREGGTLFYKDAGITRKIDYYVERIEPSGEGMLKNITVSLICPDPRWYDIHSTQTELATWEGLIEWDLEINEDPYEVTRKVSTLIGNVYNDSAVPVGLTVTFRATGDVTNPSLYDVGRQELMQINLSMHTGDVVTVTTGMGNKRVKLKSGGVTTNINNRMAYPPAWLQAYPGDNLFRYDAAAGINNLDVIINHTQAHWGA